MARLSDPITILKGIGPARAKQFENLNIFTHASYDVNDGVIDPTVLVGTDIWRLGGGVEYFPTGRRNLRIHAASCYTFGKAVPMAALQDGHLMFQAGLTWKVNLLSKN